MKDFSRSWSSELTAPLQRRMRAVAVPLRDARMDFWRGLCLLDMLLVHLVYNRMQFGHFGQDFFGEYARFAAGGFVFVAGLGIGRFYLPKFANPLTRATARLSLYRRAMVLLCAHYIATLLYTICDQLLGFATPASASWGIVRDVVLLRRGDDLLPLYVLLSAAAPALLLLLCRRRGWMILAAGSALLFCWGDRHPDALVLSTHATFRPLLWQAVFVTGLISGSCFKNYDALRKQSKLLVAGIAWAAFALLFAADYGPGLGWHAPGLGLSFWKSPLSFGEVLRYLSITIGIFAGTDLLWPIILANPLAHLLSALGRQSLIVYITHNLLVLAIAATCDQFWWWGKWQMLMIIPAVALLWLSARIAETLYTPSRRPVRDTALMPEPTSS